MTILGEELAPHFHVTILDPRQLAIDTGLLRVPLGLSQLPVQKCSVGFIFEVVEPIVRG
jgi:hypothetical protein